MNINYAKNTKPMFTTVYKFITDVVDIHEHRSYCISNTAKVKLHVQERRTRSRRSRKRGTNNSCVAFNMHINELWTSMRE